MGESANHDRVKDAGMALSLLFLLAGLWGGYGWAYYAAAAALLLNMIWPPAFTPFAWLWYGLAEVLGFVSSRIILSLVFFLVVTPVALVRKLMGKDALQLGRFKKGQDSTFRKREHTFEAGDVEEVF